MTDDDAVDAGYVACMEAMNRAASAWMKAHPFAELSFDTRGFVERAMARAGKTGVDWTKVAIAASLSDCMTWAKNEDTRAFLRAVNEAVGGQATFMQMRALLDMQTEARLERSRQRLSPAGDWACTGCGTVLDGCTSFGDDGAPIAGAPMVCVECGTIQRFSADATHYEALPTADLNRLPKRVRKTLLAVREMVLKRRADDAARS